MRFPHTRLWAPEQALRQATPWLLEVMMLLREVKSPSADQIAAIEHAIAVGEKEGMRHGRRRVTRSCLQEQPITAVISEG